MQHLHKDPMIGKQFSEWKVLSLSPRRFRGEKLYWCECSCGKTTKEVTSSRLRTGEAKGCIKCLHHRRGKKYDLPKVTVPRGAFGPFKDLAGKRYGRWTVLRRAPNQLTGGHGRVYFTCQCSCKDKTVKDILASSLRQSYSKSCGCILKEIRDRKVEKNRNVEKVDYNFQVIVSRRQQITI